jgi:membrane fusion protein, multidrug efflux system
VYVRKYVVTFVAVLMVLLTACDSKTPVATSAAATPAPRAVKDTEPAATDEYIASGPLVVENQVDVPAQRAGVVARIEADVADRVRKGQVLAELDNRQLLAERDAADAKLKSTKFELEHWQAETKVRDSDRSRDEEMFKASLITAKQLEHSQYAVEGAKFETQREEQNVRNAQQALRAMELELEKTRIIAPFDGVVARRYVRVGQKVAISDRVFWVTALSPIDVKFTVPQELVGKLKRGDQVSVITPSMPGKPHGARITIVSPVVDPSSGTFEVQARLADSAADLLPGMTVNIRIPKNR